MFMDGQQYACVAKNLADGYGTWWFPYLSDTWWKAGSGNFMEHPPLVYWLQAGFFKVLGDSMYTERIYSFCTAIVTAFLIHKTWKLLFIDRPEIAKMSALPIILWIIVPVNFWGYQHNIMENTMGVFTLLAVYLFLIGLNKNPVKNYVYLVLCGISISLAFLSKGPPGLFPLVVIGCYWMAYRNFRIGRMLLNSFFLLVVVMTFFLILTLIPAAYESLGFYVNERLLYRVEHEPTTGNHFSILLRLFMELLPALGFVVVSIIVSYTLKLKADKFLLFQREFLFFLLLGLAGSLPLMLTPVQRGFYLNPSWPFWGIALACLAAPFLKMIGDKALKWNKYDMNVKMLGGVMIFFSIGLTAANAGKARRDGEMLTDIHKIVEVVPERSIIVASPDFFDRWNTKFYLMRYGGISVDIENQRDYYLLDKGVQPYFNNYQKVNIETTLYDLYQRQEDLDQNP